MDDGGQMRVSGKPKAPQMRSDGSDVEKGQRKEIRRENESKMGYDGNVNFAQVTAEQELPCPTYREWKEHRRCACPLCERARRCLRQIPMKHARIVGEAVHFLGISF